MAQANYGEDFVNGRIWRQSTIENSKVSFQTLWNVISASAWVDHCSQKLKGKNTKAVRLPGDGAVYLSKNYILSIILRRVITIERTFRPTELMSLLLLLTRFDRPIRHILDALHLNGEKNWRVSRNKSSKWGIFAFIYFFFWNVSVEKRYLLYFTLLRILR